jgi:hypothetical protein
MEVSMIDEYFLRKKGWFVDDTFTREDQITPEQNLLQELITSACRACDSYLKRGKIRGVQGNKALAEFIWNLSALRVVDEEMLETAGFRYRAKMRTVIGDIIAKGNKITRESKEVNVCV